MRKLTVSIGQGALGAIQWRLFLALLEVRVIVVFPRAEAPAAKVWPGRRWLAALDALLWPAALLALLLRVDVRPGIVGAVGFAVACGCALQPLQRALARNERYEFTSWKWGRWLMLIASLGLTLQLALRGGA